RVVVLHAPDSSGRRAALGPGARRRRGVDTAVCERRVWRRTTASVAGGWPARLPLPGTRGVAERQVRVHERCHGPSEGWVESIVFLEPLRGLPEALLRGRHVPLPGELPRLLIVGSAHLVAAVRAPGIGPREPEPHGPGTVVLAAAEIDDAEIRQGSAP